MKVEMHPTWDFIRPMLFQEPLSTLNTLLTQIKYYPEREDIFNVFKLPMDKVKVVILGQDPYPNPGDAIGRAFAVSEDRKIPVSLRIIREEILNSCGSNSFQQNTGENWQTLEHWEEQGVLLLNTALTVEAGKAGSHLNFWEPFTQRLIMHLSKEHPCIWILWGKKAQYFKKYIFKPYIFTDVNLEHLKDLPVAGNYNFILESAHPAAEAYAGGNAGFYGNRHFSKVNKILGLKNQSQINW